MNTSSRRAFLKRSSFVLSSAALGGSVYGQQAQSGAGMSSFSFIRVRPKPQSAGWKYYRVRTMAEYPVLQDENGEQKELFQPSQYGGNALVSWKATGKFRTEKVDDRWWLVDPEGHPFLSCGINSVSPVTGGGLARAVKQRGGETLWSEEVVEMLKARGFNTAGYWSKASGADQEQTILKGMPYVYYGFARNGDPRAKSGGTAQGLMGGFAVSKGVTVAGSYPVFHREFEAFCDERCKVIESVKNDPWLLGYFTDNELRFMSLSRSLEVAVNDPIYGDAGAEARRWLQERGRQDVSLKDLTEEDNRAWMGHVFEWYYRVTTKAVRKYDPDHLLLGTRVYSVERNYPEVFAAAGKYLDVMSLNPYGMAAVSAGQLKQWSRWAGDKPLMIGEFYVKGLDVDLANKRGAGLLVATQEERGLYYQNYVLGLLMSGVCVGWHWHRYADDEGFKGQAEYASNKGIVTSDLQPYEALLGRMEELNLRLYEVVGRMGRL